MKKRWPCPADHRTANLLAVPLQVDGKLEQLGELYNEVEEQLYKLECADRSREESFKGLKERLLLLEAWKTDSQRANQQSEKANGVSPVIQHRAVDLTPIEEKLASHESTLSEISRCLQQLESREPAAILTTSQSTHQLAQSLIQRIHDGDVLSSLDASQLKAALGQKTLSTTKDSQKQSDVPALIESNETDEKPVKRKRDRPPLSSLEGDSNDEPPMKRPRGRPSLRAAEGSGIQQSTEKKPLGRPRKNAASSKKAESKSDPAPSDISKLNGVTTMHEEGEHVADAGPADAEVLPSTEDQTMEEATQKETVDSIPESAHTSISETTSATDSDSTAPPERRSGREHKSTKKFGDYMSWKEENLHTQRRKSKSSPSKTDG